MRDGAIAVEGESIVGVSPHAAMVRAGFRPATFTVRADSVESAARALRRHLTTDQLSTLARLLKEG